MEMVGDQLVSSELQCGFKRKSSCNHALFALWSVEKQLCDSGSTATFCALDISKAFVKVNVYGLLKMLMGRAFPRTLIKLLLDWFGKGVGNVHWTGSIFSIFPILAGV
jgi:hypothetical protein